MKSSSIIYGKSLWTSIIVMLLISLAMVPMAAEGEINSTGTYFWVDPKENIVEPYCTQFPVNIMIENAPETYAWEATLEFDNNTLGVMSVSEGPWLSEDDTKDTTFTTSSWVEANKTGTISIGCTLLGEVPGTNGSGVLCTIVFHVEYCGRSPLDLQDTALLDMALLRTDYPNNDGFFCAVCAVECLHDIAIVNVTANPTQVTCGVTVSIIVTIKNEGNHTQHVNVTVSAIYEFCGVVHEVPIGTNSCTTIVPGQTIPVKFNWVTTGVPGEKYKIKTVVVKTDAPDDDPHDNVFIGPEVHVTCFRDIKVKTVNMLTPWVYVGYTASAEITVVNEGKNRADVDQSGTITGLDIMIIQKIANFMKPVGPDPPDGAEDPRADVDQSGTITGLDIMICQKIANFMNTTSVTFEVEVYAGAAKVATVDIINLAEGESRDVIGTWIPSTAAVYPIKANVTAYLGETDTTDNEKVDGAVKVIYDDVAVIGATMNATTVPYCSTVGINTTILNNGTDIVRFLVYVWADPTPGAPFDGDELLTGLIVGGTLATGANHTFIGLAPYGGIATSEYTLVPPNTPLLAGTYGIFVLVVKQYGTDLNPNNDVFYAGTLTVT